MVDHVKLTSTELRICNDNSIRISCCFHMDSPIISRLFKQLFSRRACQSVHVRSSTSLRIQNGSRSQVRHLSASRRHNNKATSAKDNHWQQRTELFPEDMSEEYKKYPMVTADQLRTRRERPTRVKMFTRDFIEG